jgi:hypothetical protein
MVVHTATSGAGPSTGSPRPHPGGHNPRGGGASPQHAALGLGQMVTATGVAVHWIARGGAPRAALRARLRLLSSPFDFTFANVLTPPSDHHLVHVC